MFNGLPQVGLPDALVATRNPGALADRKQLFSARWAS
jgi:hypothetical protein